MARRCLCSRLLAAANTDPRLRTLPLAARALWLFLAEAMAASPLPGTLPFAGTARLALLVAAPETEVETHLETLIAEGLILRTGEGGLACPLLLEVAARSASARQNGSRGGRPRAGETPEQARARRQGSLLLPVAGGAVPALAETQETETAKPASRPAAPITTTTIQVSSPVNTSGSEDARARAREAAALGERIAVIASLDPVRQRFDFAPVRTWLAQGISADAILAGVQAVVDRDTYEAGRIHTLRYFEPSVLKHHDATPAPAGVAKPHDPQARANAQAVLDWLDRGMMGPAPQFAA